ncbi:MAG: hypothetical protein ACTHKG_19555 [Nocardioides sp.]
MDVAALLTETEPAIVDEAYAALERSHSRHYEIAGESLTRQRLADLSHLVIAAIRDRDLAEMSVYAEKVARERFDDGYDVSEVQAAFNVLEQAMWRQVVDATPPTELAEAVGLLSTVLGFGKDTLARTYVSLASQRHVPSLDLSALFAGIE